jgi:hypothetical protein
MPPDHPAGAVGRHHPPSLSRDLSQPPQSTRHGPALSRMSARAHGAGHTPEWSGWVERVLRAAVGRVGVVDTSRAIQRSRLVPRRLVHTSSVLCPCRSMMGVSQHCVVGLVRRRGAAHDQWRGDRRFSMPRCARPMTGRKPVARLRDAAQTAVRSSRLAAGRDGRGPISGSVVTTACSWRSCDDTVPAITWAGIWTNRENTGGRARGVGQPAIRLFKLDRATAMAGQVQRTALRARAKRS